MGDAKNIKPQTRHDVRVIDPTPVWMGIDRNSPAIQYFMNTEVAEAWMKEDPKNRTVKLNTTAGQLRQYDQQQNMHVSVWDI